MVHQWPAYPPHHIKTGVMEHFCNSHCGGRKFCSSRSFLSCLGVPEPAGDTRDPESKLILYGVKCPDLKYTHIYWHIFKNTGVGEMARRLGVLAALPEVPSSTPSFHHSGLQRIHAGRRLCTNKQTLLKKREREYWHMDPGRKGVSRS